MASSQMRRARSCPPITSCANAATCQQLRSHMITPCPCAYSVAAVALAWRRLQIQHQARLFARETQTVIRSLAHFSASVRKTSRWSGSPSSTPVRHVPHTPCSHEVSTITPCSASTSMIVRPSAISNSPPWRASLHDEAALRSRERGRVGGKVLEVHGLRRPRGRGGRLDEIHERTRPAQVEMPVRWPGPQQLAQISAHLLGLERVVEADAAAIFRRRQELVERRVRDRPGEIDEREFGAGAQELPRHAEQRRDADARRRSADDASRQATSAKLLRGALIVRRSPSRTRSCIACEPPREAGSRLTAIW